MPLSCSTNTCQFVLFQEVLELAFSILYDSSGQLNFIAPDKHEVSQVQNIDSSFEALSRCLMAADSFMRT